MDIVNRSLPDQAFDIVREQILSQRIAPLTPIRQDALAKSLGISKIPLREALARLEQYGLLKSNPNRGYFVPELSAMEADEIFALRMKIEPEAGVHSSLHASEAQRDAARSALAALEAATENADTDIVVLNRQFHLALTRPGTLLVTSQLVERFLILAERYVRKHLEPEGREIRAADEHQIILTAWLARDVGRLETLIAGHVALTLRDLRKQLGSDPDGPPAHKRHLHIVPTASKRR